MIVPNPDELRRNSYEVYAAPGSNGSAHALPMSEQDLVELAERAKRRLPFGFQPPARPKPKKRKRKKARR